MMKSMIAAVALLAMPISAEAAEFINGSFETGVPFPGQFTKVSAVDSTSVTGWTVASGSIDYIGSYWNAQSGGRSIDLSGDNVSVLQQTFDTIVGKKYNVKFFLGGNPFGGPTLKTLTVSAGPSNLSAGLASQNYNYDTTGAPPLPGMNWLAQNFSFTATGTSSTLAFTSTTETAFGPALDSVSVAAVPEPATWAMMIFGFGLVGAALRRRRIGAFAAA